MTELELLERRIDNVHSVLEMPMSEWGKNYWTTVLFGVRDANERVGKELLDYCIVCVNS